MQPSGEIDRDIGDEQGDQTLAGTNQELALLRTEWRLEELDVAIDAAAHAARTVPTPAHHRRVCKLEQAYQHELRVHEAIRRQVSAENSEVIT